MDTDLGAKLTGDAALAVDRRGFAGKLFGVEEPAPLPGAGP